jgi:hypothetical protein
MTGESAAPPQSADAASALLRRMRAVGPGVDDGAPLAERVQRWGDNAHLLTELPRPVANTLEDKLETVATDRLELSVALTNEAEYCFDVAGYLPLRGVLGAAQLADLNDAIDSGGGAVSGMLSWAPGLREPFRELLVEPTLVACLNELVGYGYRLDRHPELLCADAGTYEVGGPLRGGNEPREPGSAYYFRNGRRYCQRVLVLWALCDVPHGAGGFVFVPNSHRCQAEPPAQLQLGGGGGGGPLAGILQQPELHAGDCFIVAASCLHGLAPWVAQHTHRLLCYEFVGRGVVGAVGPGPLAQTPPGQPDPRFSSEQQALQYAPGYVGSSPPPAVVSDGERVWLDPERAVFHPSIYTAARNPTIDPAEFYCWNLNGYLILRGVMDAEWLRLANEAIDSIEHTATTSEELSGGAPRLVGGAQRRIGGLLDLLTGSGRAAFERMVAHPGVHHRLNWMGGSGMKGGLGSIFASECGASGHFLHNNGEPLYPHVSPVARCPRLMGCMGPCSSPRAESSIISDSIGTHCGCSPCI